MPWELVWTGAGEDHANLITDEQRARGSFTLANFFILLSPELSRVFYPRKRTNPFSMLQLSSSQTGNMWDSSLTRITMDISVGGVYFKTNEQYPFQMAVSLEDLTSADFPCFFFSSARNKCGRSIRFPKMDRIFRCELIYEPLISPRDASIMFDPAKKIAVSAI